MGNLTCCYRPEEKKRGGTNVKTLLRRTEKPTKRRKRIDDLVVDALKREERGERLQKRREQNEVKKLNEAPANEKSNNFERNISTEKEEKFPVADQRIREDNDRSYTGVVSKIAEKECDGNCGHDQTSTEIVNIPKNYVKQSVQCREREGNLEVSHSEERIKLPTTQQTDEEINNYSEITATSKAGDADESSRTVVNNGLHVVTYEKCDSKPDPGDFESLTGAHCDQETQKKDITYKDNQTYENRDESRHKNEKEEKCDDNIDTECPNYCPKTDEQKYDNVIIDEPGKECISDKDINREHGLKDEQCSSEICNDTIIHKTASNHTIYARVEQVFHPASTSNCEDMLECHDCNETQLSNSDAENQNMHVDTKPTKHEIGGIILDTDTNDSTSESNDSLALEEYDNVELKCKHGYVDVAETDNDEKRHQDKKSQDYTNDENAGGNGPTDMGHEFKENDKLELETATGTNATNESLDLKNTESLEITDYDNAESSEESTDVGDGGRSGAYSEDICENKAALNIQNDNGDITENSTLEPKEEFSQNQSDADTKNSSNDLTIDGSSESLNVVKDMPQRKSESDITHTTNKTEDTNNGDKRNDAKRDDVGEAEREHFRLKQNIEQAVSKSKEVRVELIPRSIGLPIRRSKMCLPKYGRVLQPIRNMPMQQKRPTSPLAGNVIDKAKSAKLLSKLKSIVLKHANQTPKRVPVTQTNANKCLSRIEIMMKNGRKPQVREIARLKKDPLSYPVRIRHLSEQDRHGSIEDLKWSRHMRAEVRRETEREMARVDMEKHMSMKDRYSSGKNSSHRCLVPDRPDNLPRIHSSSRTAITADVKSTNLSRDVKMNMAFKSMTIELEKRLKESLLSQQETRNNTTFVGIGRQNKSMGISRHTSYINLCWEDEETEL